MCSAPGMRAFAETAENENVAVCVSLSDTSTWVNESKLSSFVSRCIGRQTLYRCPHEAVLERLRDRHPVLYQRPGYGKARCDRFQADDVSIADAGPRNQVLDRKMILVQVARVWSRRSKPLP